ncbi:MAG: DeoR/GlpR family DNA-binding transcription regulator [Saccharofermentanales bacterium]
MIINIKKRQQQILDCVQDRGEISVNELIDIISASPATIRRDISTLHNEGLISRSHGFIHVVDKDDSVLPLFNRKIIAASEKEQIAIKAAELVQPGMTVILDSGSTCLAIALAIMDKEITVVTNSIEICSTLASTNIKVICTGGILENRHMCFLGRDANIFIEKIEVDIGFIGATGIRVDKGFTTSSPLQYDFKKQLIMSSRKPYIVFDSNKFYSANLYVFANYTDNFTGIITNSSDDELVQKQLKVMADNGLDVILSQ